MSEACLSITALFVIRRCKLFPRDINFVEIFFFILKLTPVYVDASLFLLTFHSSNKREVFRKARSSKPSNPFFSQDSAVVSITSRVFHPVHGSWFQPSTQNCLQ